MIHSHVDRDIPSIILNNLSLFTFNDSSLIVGITAASDGAIITIILLILGG